METRHVPGEYMDMEEATQFCEIHLASQCRALSRTNFASNCSFLASPICCAQAADRYTNLSKINVTHPEAITSLYLVRSETPTNLAQLMEEAENCLLKHSHRIVYSLP